MVYIIFLKKAQEHVQQWFKEQDEDELSTEDPIHPQALARAISDAADNNAIIACDTGNVTAARFVRLL